MTLVFNGTIDQFPSASDGALFTNDIPAQFHNVIVLYARILAAGPKGVSREMTSTVSYWTSLFSSEFAAMLESVGIDPDQDSVVDVQDVESYA